MHSEISSKNLFPQKFHHWFLEEFSQDVIFEKKKSLWFLWEIPSGIISRSGLSYSRSMDMKQQQLDRHTCQNLLLKRIKHFMVLPHPEIIFIQISQYEILQIYVMNSCNNIWMNHWRNSGKHCWGSFQWKPWKFLQNSYIEIPVRIPTGIL